LQCGQLAGPLDAEEIPARRARVFELIVTPLLGVGIVPLAKLLAESIRVDASLDAIDRGSVGAGGRFRAAAASQHRRYREDSAQKSYGKVSHVLEIISATHKRPEHLTVVRSETNVYSPRDQINTTAAFYTQVTPCQTYLGALGFAFLFLI
jgi:hypothetical protein